MNDLPQELVDWISSYLPRCDLKNTLLLSRKFQLAAERYSGAFTDFTLTESNVGQFLDTYSDRRFGYLRNVEFRTSVKALEWEEEVDLDLEDDELLDDQDVDLEGGGDQVEDEDGHEDEGDQEDDDLADAPDEDEVAQEDDEEAQQENIDVLEEDSDSQHDNENPACRDTQEELRKMDEEFTSQITLLFSTIQKVENRAGKAHRSGKIELTIYTPTRAIDRNWYCMHRVFTSWRIHLLSSEKLPRLTSVRTLIVQPGIKIEYQDEPYPSLRKLDLRTLIDLSSKLPNLDTLQVKIGGDEFALFAETEAVRYTTQDWAGPRRDSRHDFSAALKGIKLLNLRHANLDFIAPLSKADWIDQRVAQPNLVSPAAYDPFSNSLRILSYQLCTLRLRAVADSTLFWPIDGTMPSWPSLTSLNVMFHLATPSGSWYFNGPSTTNDGATDGFEVTESSYPSYQGTKKDEKADADLADYNWDEPRVNAQYRVFPNEQTLIPFLASFAKALSCMPKLKEAALWSPLRFNPNSIPTYKDLDDESISEFGHGELAWGVAYTGPGARVFNAKPAEMLWKVGEAVSDARQWFWRVGKWRPDAELRSLFQEVGRKEHGGELVEHWDDESTSSERLVPRDSFSRWESHRWYL